MGVSTPDVETLKRVVDKLAERHGGVAQMCRLVGLAESSYYYEQHGRTDKQQDGVLLQALVKLAGGNPRRGYRYLWRQVRKQKGFAGVNRKRVQRVLKMAGIKCINHNII